MPSKPAPSGRCPICGDPLAPATQTLFEGQYHEACLPDCANCGRTVEAHSCDRVWKDEGGTWKARHKVCP